MISSIEGSAKPGIGPWSKVQAGNLSLVVSLCMCSARMLAFACELSLERAYLQVSRALGRTTICACKVSKTELELSVVLVVS